MEGKTFESKLPEGYKKALEIDAGKGKWAVIFNVIALVVLVVVLAIAIPLAVIKNESVNIYQSPLALIIFLVSMLIYIVLHEIVHGICYKALTKQKLTFGLKLTCAYCGVPNIFTYRKTALISVLAPFVVFTLVFLPLVVWAYYFDSIYFILASILLGIHLGGCSGDLYVAYLLLFKFKAKTTLMNDTGPVMTLYIRED